MFLIKSIIILDFPLWPKTFRVYENVPISIILFYFRSDNIVLKMNKLHHLLTFYKIGNQKTENYLLAALQFPHGLSVLHYYMPTVLL